MQVNLQKRENIQTTILALLLTHKGGCTLKQLDSDYYDFEGEHIPWRDLGYASLLNFLSSMSKTVKVEKENNMIIVKGIASEKSKHVSKLVGNQKCQKPPVKRKSYKPSHYFPKTAPPRVRIPAEILRKIVDLVNNHPDGVNKNYVLQEVQACMSFVNISMEDMEEQLHELSHQIYQLNNKIYPVCSGKIKNSDCLKEDNNMSITVAGNENIEIALNFEEGDIFDFIPSACTDYLDQTKSITKIKPTANFIQETVSKCQDQVVEHTLFNHIYKDSAQNQIEHNMNVKKDKEEYLYYKDCEILISERVKFRLEKLIQNHPDGLWCADLPEKYLEEYKVSLNYTELGFNSVREFASQLPEIFHCIQFCDTGDFKLYYAKREIPSSKTKEIYKTNNLMELHHIYEASNEEPLPAEVSLNTCKILIPDDVLTIGENVGYINVAQLVENMEPFVEVVVVEVFTPSFFWIQLRKAQKVFKTFMNDLHNFYAIKSEQYVIPPVTLEKGLHCACMYNGVWHRGVIKTVKPDFQVTIMFYDYGTLKTYPPEAIYYLHRMFSNLPAQAIPCGLINVRPRKGSKWSRSATHNFAMRTSEIPLIATIASINIEDNSMMVSLTDTLEEEDVHINDWLVEQKFAEHGKMVDKVDMSNILIYIEENLIFKPEQCYEMKTNMFNNSNSNNNKSSKKVPNVPLISPQSTLNDNNFKCLPQPTLFNEQKVLQIKENIQNRIFQNGSTPTMCTSSKNNTNPFLQDVSVYNEVNDNISPGSFMQLWNENLRIQMEITVTLSRLLNRVMKESEKNVKDDSVHNQDTLNMIKDALVSVKQMPVFVNSTCNSTISSIGKNTDMNNDLTNVEYPSEKSTCTARSWQPSSTPFCDRNHNLNTCIASTQINITPNVTKTSNLANSTSLMPTNNDFDNLTQFLTNHEAAKQYVSSESERCSNKSKLDSQNYFINDTNIDLLKTAENTENNKMPLKETNPFRLSLAGKLDISDTNEANCSRFGDSLPSTCKDHDSLIDYDLINFNNNNPKTNCANRSILNDFNNISLNNHEHFMPDSSNKTSDEKQHSSLNCNWNVGDVTNKVADDISDQSTQHSVRENKAERRCFPTLKIFTTDHDLSFIEKRNEQELIHDISNFNQSSMNEKLSFPSNYDMYNYKSTSLLPVNDLECSTPVNDENSNEGCSTSLSTSHTLCSSSPIMELSTKLNGVQNSTVKDLLNFQVNIDDTRTENPHSKESGLRNVEESLCSKNHPPLTTKLFFQVVELPKRMIHIFHYQDEGWLLVNEFVEAFTTFETTLHLLSMLRALNIRVRFEEIDKTKNSIEFIQNNVNHNTVLLKATCDTINGATKLHLMPLQSAIKVLHKLEIISQEDLSDLLKIKKFMNDSTLNNIWLITSAYKQLKCLIKSEQ